MSPAQGERGAAPLRFQLPWSRQKGDSSKKSGPRSLSASLAASAGTVTITNEGSRRFPDTFRNPALSAADEDGRGGMVTGRNSEVAEWEVYMCYRALHARGSSFYQRLPDFIKMELRDVGLCHYMVVLKRKHQSHRRKDLRWWDSQTGRAGQEQNEYIQFDFGPRGYDITFSRAAKKPTRKTWKPQQLPNLPGSVDSPRLSSPLGLNFVSGKMTPLALPAKRAGGERVYPVFALPGFAPPSTVELWAGEDDGEDGEPSGEIREEQLSELPSTAELVGTVVMSLKDIRSFNRTLNMDYVLSRNDCRHYVDSLMEFLTGAEKACATFMRRRMQERLEKYAACRSQPRKAKVPSADLRHHLLQLAQLALEKESGDVISRVLSTLSAKGLPRLTPFPEPDCSSSSLPQFSMQPPAYHDSARMRPAPAGAGKSRISRSDQMQPMLVPVNWAQRGQSSLHLPGNATPSTTPTGLGRTRRPPPRSKGTMPASAAMTGTMLSVLSSTIGRQKGKGLLSFGLRNFWTASPGSIIAATQPGPALRPRLGIRYSAASRPSKQRCTLQQCISRAIKAVA